MNEPVVVFVGSKETMPVAPKLLTYNHICGGSSLYKIPELVIVGVISARNLRLWHPSSCLIVGCDPNSIINWSRNSHNSD